MRRFLRSLVVKACRRLRALAGCRPNKPANPTTWELIPFSFEVDWIRPIRVSQPQPTCSCYYCRHKVATGFGSSLGHANSGQEVP